MYPGMHTRVAGLAGVNEALDAMTGVDRLASSERFDLYGDYEGLTVASFAAFLAYSLGNRIQFDDSFTPVLLMAASFFVLPYLFVFYAHEVFRSNRLLWQMGLLGATACIGLTVGIMSKHDAHDSAPVWPPVLVALAFAIVLSQVGLMSESAGGSRPVLLAAGVSMAALLLAGGAVIAGAAQSSKCMAAGVFALIWFGPLYFQVEVHLNRSNMYNCFNHALAAVYAYCVLVFALNLTG